MRILHTSDWHLGKLFHEKSLLEDQEYVLNQIIEIMVEAKNDGNPFAALLISGDIYDRAMPPSEAGVLLNNFLEKAATRLPELHIFIISGNHDSASRLSFASGFLEHHNIHIATDTKNITKPVILEQNGQKTAFYQLPFLTPLSIESENSEELNRTQQQLYSGACKKIIENHKKNYGNMPSVINAHLYTLGCAVSASERTNVGTVEQVDVSVFDGFTYGAFGHIHKFQVCNKQKNCYYSGALLPYNFDDSPKTGLLDVDIKGDSEVPCVKRILFNPLHSVVKITAEMKNLIGSQADTKLVKENQNNYVQVILTDAVMPTEAFANLKSVFPNLLSVVMQQQEHEKSNLSIQQRKAAIDSHQPQKIFEQFIKDIYGEFPDNELIKKQQEIFLKESQNNFFESSEN